MVKRYKKSQKTKVKVVKVIPRNEIKIYDVSLGLPVSTASIWSLSDISQGTSKFQRIGTSVSSKFLHVKVNLTASTALLGSTVSTVRMIIFFDNQQIQATAPLMTDIINPLSTVGQRNIFFLSRFSIRKDMLIKVDTYNPTVDLSFNLRLGPTISYASSISTDIVKSGLYVILLSNNVVNPPNIVFTSRLGFSDA